MTISKTVLTATGLLMLPAVFIDSYAQQAIRPGMEFPSLVIQKSVRTVQPAYTDNSTKPWFPEIISQYGNSCAQASGIHYLYTYEVNRMLGRAADSDDNVFSYRHIWHFLNDGKNEGGFTSDGLELTKNGFAVTVADYGAKESTDWYYRWPSGYDKYLRALRYRTSSINTINLRTQSGIETLCQYMTDKGDGLEGGGIAGFSLSGDSWGVSHYEGPSATGYADIVNMTGTGGSHAMVLAGFDKEVEYDCNGNGIIEDDEKGAFILVNSWGSWWGSNGRAYIPWWYFMNEAENGGLTDSEADALVIGTVTYEPSTVFCVTMDYSSRNDLRFELGVADGAGADKPDMRSSVYPRILCNQGGDLPLTGYSGGGSFQTVFDYTPKAVIADTMKAPCYFLTAIQTAYGSVGTGSIREIEIRDCRSGNTLCSRKFSAEEGLIKGRRNFAIPTKPWYKNSKGYWYRLEPTSANPVSKGNNVFNDSIFTKRIAVRSADAEGCAVMTFGDYDSVSHRIEVDLKYFEK